MGDDRQTRAAHGTIVAYLALFVALGGTGAYAVDKIGSGIKDNAIKTRHIGSGQVKTADLGGSSVNGAKVANTSLGGADINEASLGLGLLRGETPGPDPQSVRYVTPSGRTTATFTDPNDVAHLTPPVPTIAADFVASATVPPGSELTLTLFVDGTPTSVGCTIDGPATTCAEEEDDALLPAGSRLAVRVEFSGTAPTDIEFSMTISPIVG